MTNVNRTVEELKAQALKLLRDARERDGNCYHGIDWLAKELQCDPAELYDWNNESGVMFDLEELEMVCVIHGQDDPAFMAYGEMQWGGDL